MRIGAVGTPVKGKKAAGIFFTDGIKVLLLKRADEGDYGCTWALPGGKAKDGETEIGNAIRETKEETGLDSIPGHRIDTLSCKNGQQKFTGFLYRVFAPFDIKLSHEHTDWDWVDLESLKNKDLHPKFKEELPRYLQAIKRKMNTFSEWSQIRKIDWLNSNQEL
jgi:8-oxo-dGTP pyrophosphatase MutT (NUDIX family)